MLQNPLDEPVPDINVPVLTPQPLSKVQRFKEYAADKRQIFKKYVNYRWNRFVNWLTHHLPQKTEIIDEAFEHVKNTILKLFPRKKDTFKVVETKSALKEFAKIHDYRKDGYDPNLFMDAAKETVIKLLENSRQTTVKLFLKCIMEKT